jgi:hypothetical protein
MSPVATHHGTLSGLPKRDNFKGQLAPSQGAATIATGLDGG